MGFCLKVSQRKMQRGESVVECRLERWTRARLAQVPTVRVLSCRL